MMHSMIDVQMLAQSGRFFQSAPDASPHVAKRYSQSPNGRAYFIDMRSFAAPLILLFVLHAGALADVTQQWAALAEKRKALVSYHQEFTRTTSYTLPDHVQSIKRSSILDGAGGALAGAYGVRVRRLDVSVRWIWIVSMGSW